MSVGFPMDFIIILWDPYDISIIFLWDSSGVSVGFP